MYFKALKIMAIWVAALVLACAILAPTISAINNQQQRSAAAATSSNSTALSPVASNANKNSTLALASETSAGKKRELYRRDLRVAESVAQTSKVRSTSSSLGDTVGLDTALSSRGDLMPAAGEHKKYMLVKKKPKHKKIKMDVYEPKMKYKKIKMKVPIKKLKKKKVKGYLVKKEHGHY